MTAQLVDEGLIAVAICTPLLGSLGTNIDPAAPCLLGLPALATSTIVTDRPSPSGSCIG